MSKFFMYFSLNNKAYVELFIEMEHVMLLSVIDIAYINIEF